MSSPEFSVRQIDDRFYVYGYKEGIHRYESNLLDDQSIEEAFIASFATRGEAEQYVDMLRKYNKMMLLG